MQFWISTGTPENWEKAVAENIWGVVEGLKSQWERLQKGDVLFFYVGAPVSGVVGFGKIENKFIEDKPYWEKEIKENKGIWKYRYDFKVEYALPRKDWGEKKISVKGLRVNIRSGLNPVKDRKTADLLVKNIDDGWQTDFSKALERGIAVATPSVKETRSPHDELKEKIYELGKIERYISEKEYRIPDTNERLDVVWRKVSAGVPTFVFEVQVGGSLHQALAKLKHANDIWNSNVFLVTGENDLGKAKQLLGGSFHEIKDRIKILTISDVKRVHELQTEDDKLKHKMGLR